MSCIAFFVQRPVATTLLLVAAVLVGLVVLPQLPVSDLPDVDLPVISVSASEAGGTAEVMARTVAAPLERHLGKIAGVTQMVSTSVPGETLYRLASSWGMISALPHVTSRSRAFDRTKFEHVYRGLEAHEQLCQPPKAAPVSLPRSSSLAGREDPSF